MAVERAGVDIGVKFGDSESHRSRDIRVSHFVMDDERQRKSSHKAERHTVIPLQHTGANDACQLRRR